MGPDTLPNSGYPDGFSIDFSVNDSPVYRSYAQLLKDQCEPAGTAVFNHTRHGVRRSGEYLTCRCVWIAGQMQPYPSIR